MDNTFAALQEFTAGKLDEYQIPGAVVGLLREGETRVAGFGVTSVDHPLPVTPDTLFQIGSITKTVTACLLLHLAEAGQVDLKAPVRTYVPEFRVRNEAASAGATIFHLLTHSANWVGDLFEDTGPGDDAKERYVALMADLEQVAPLGTLFSYCNSGFTLAGLIIERVTGRPYQQVVKDRIIDPLGMSHSYFWPGDVMVHRFAVGHQATPAGPAVAAPWPLPRYAFSAGGIICPAGDLLRYARFYLDGGQDESGRQLLSKESLSAMWQVRQPIGEHSGAMGLGWFLQDINGLRTVQHGGATVGQTSILVLVPDHRLAFTISANATNGGQLIKAVSRWIIKTYVGVEPADPAPVSATGAQLDELVGRYVRPLMALDITRQEQHLLVQVTFLRPFPTRDSPLPPPVPPFRCGLLASGDLVALEGPFEGSPAEVLRRPDGRPGWIRFARRIHARQDG